ncbi:hypothetical protein M9H77_22286 [Catharanthus roseus]|uniref:Uncharacterized protein n=1 Tax=Catharanthus roseus TaxID=4058 RepID=A0ACC0AU41_CATRO|nr:hypothetical protein M9H77_22286 [Catharanthus roseus]
MDIWQELFHKIKKLPLEQVSYLEGNVIYVLEKIAKSNTIDISLLKNLLTSFFTKTHEFDDTRSSSSEKMAKEAHKKLSSANECSSASKSKVSLKKIDEKIQSLKKKLKCWKNKRALLLSTLKEQEMQLMKEERAPLLKENMLRLRLPTYLKKNLRIKEKTIKGGSPQIRRKKRDRPQVEEEKHKPITKTRLTARKKKGKKKKKKRKAGERELQLQEDRKAVQQHKSAVAEGRSREENRSSCCLSNSTADLKQQQLKQTTETKAKAAARLKKLKQLRNSSCRNWTKLRKIVAAEIRQKIGSCEEIKQQKSVGIEIKSITCTVPVIIIGDINEVVESSAIEELLELSSIFGRKKVRNTVRKYLNFEEDLCWRAFEDLFTCLEFECLLNDLSTLGRPLYIGGNRALGCLATKLPKNVGQPIFLFYEAERHICLVVLGFI